MTDLIDHFKNVGQAVLTNWLVLRRYIYVVVHICIVGLLSSWVIGVHSVPGLHILHM